MTWSPASCRRDAARAEKGIVIVDLGKLEAVLPQSEQVPGESYEHGSRIRCVVVHVAKGFRGPQITLSRSHPALVKKLFALEVPEIADGTVEIAAIAREAGHRTKIAVRSTVPGVNAKGACIGPMGQRVRAVMSELHGEKIDIIDWSDDPAQFVGNALSPAKALRVEVVDAGHPDRPGDRAGLPAVAGDRPGGAERPAGRPADRLAHRHPSGQRAGRTGRRSAMPPRPEADRIRAARGTRGRLSAVVDASRPVRTCVGCRKRAPASELLRFVAVGSGDDLRLQPDPGRRLPGRGAHLHPDPACFALAERRRAFGRALRLTGVADTGSLAEHIRAVSVPPGTTDDAASVPHPDQQGRTTDMSTR